MGYKISKLWDLVFAQAGDDEFIDYASMRRVLALECGFVTEKTVMKVVKTFCSLGLLLESPKALVYKISKKKGGGAKK